MKVKESNESFLKCEDYDQNSSDTTKHAWHPREEWGLIDSSLIHHRILRGSVLFRTCAGNHSCCEFMGAARPMSHQEDRFQHFPSCLLHSFHLHYLMKIVFNFEISLRDTRLCLVSPLLTT